MSSQLFEEEAPVQEAPKNGRSPRTPRPVEPEEALTDPFGEDTTPVIAEEKKRAPVEPVVPPAPPAEPATLPAVAGPRALADERQSITHTFKLASAEGLLVIGLYDDGTPGEVLAICRKAAGTTAAKVEAFTEALNIALPYGVPAGALASALQGLGDGNEATQYIATYLANKFG